MRLNNFFKLLLLFLCCLLIKVILSYALMEIYANHSEDSYSLGLNMFYIVMYVIFFIELPFNALFFSLFLIIKRVLIKKQKENLIYYFILNLLFVLFIGSVLMEDFRIIFSQNVSLIKISSVMYYNNYRFITSLITSFLFTLIYFYWLRPKITQNKI